MVLKDKNICYAKKGKMRMIWNEVDTGISGRHKTKFNNDYDSFIKEINEICHARIFVKTAF